MRIRNTLIFILLLLAVGNCTAQDAANQTIRDRLFVVFENTCDQEGFFYTPTPLIPRNWNENSASRERMLAEAEANSNYPAAGNLALELAAIAFQDDQKEKAETYLITALDAWENAKNPLYEGVTLAYLGYLNYLNQDFNETLDNLDESDRAFKNAGISITPYIDLLKGQACVGAKSFSVAESLLKQSFTGLTNEFHKARAGVQLAEVMIRLNHYTEAMKYLDAAALVYTNRNDKNGLAMVWRDRGIIHFKETRYEDAVTSFKKSVGFSPQLSTAKLLKETYLKMFTLASFKGEHDRSNQINIIYTQLRDSINNVEAGRVVNSSYTHRELFERDAILEMLLKKRAYSYTDLTHQELEQSKELTELELEKLEKEKIIEDLNAAKLASDRTSLEREEQIRQLTQQKALQDLALSRKELEMSRVATVRNSLIIGFLGLGIIAFLLFTRNRNQKKSHEELNNAYEELTQTHKQLIETQEQLVHAQKMASLGQLTAGIAHEIQNPLNFINNFSDVSVELIEEYKADPASNQEALEDLSANLKKIAAHGKRADKIVKGMLLHSRSGTEEKQLVNLNQVIDELLELSYHGTRSSQHNFKATIHKNFDHDLKEISLVVNDFSRVLVNLFNNAFYAMNAKAMQSDRTYTPELTVTTKKSEDQAVITIRDNGTGIPESLKQKIFDPFFTTKPAGQGTGLGLSLSFDIIIKGHNGTMQLNSEEGEYSEFIISIPLN